MSRSRRHQLLDHGIEFTDIPDQDRLAVTAFIYCKLIVAREGGSDG